MLICCNFFDLAQVRIFGIRAKVKFRGLAYPVDKGSSRWAERDVDYYVIESISIVTMVSVGLSTNMGT